MTRLVASSLLFLIGLVAPGIPQIDATLLINADSERDLEDGMVRIFNHFS